MRISRSVVVGVSLLLSLNQANAQDLDPNADSNNITNFSQLVKAVESGEDVRGIIHFDNCEATGPLATQAMRRLEGATTRFNFTNYFHGQETINNVLIDTVTTSMKIFIQNPAGEFLTLSGRLSVFDDNTVTLHVNFFDPILHKQQMVVDWTCNFNKDDGKNGLVLFNS